MAQRSSGGALAARASALAERRQRLGRDLSGRFWLRLHASLIVSATFGAGFLANLALLQLGLDAVLARWLLAIAIGYSIFFLLVRLWLAYVGARAMLEPDMANVVVIDAGPGRPAIDVPFRGSGGAFGGGGATGDFATARSLTGEAALARPLPASGKASAVGFDLDIGDGFLVVVLGLIVLALVASLFGTALYFVWIAPELLVDAAFGALLASGALKGLRRIDEPDWDGHVWRATWKPLATVVVVAIVAALALGHWFPKARSLGDAWRMIG